MNISRRALFGSAAAASLSYAQRSSPPDRRPNIVFVITDDLRYDGLSCTGHAFAKTPHIDRLAAEGAMFNNFFTAVPLCSPSRACFLTGLYPHTNRIINNDKTGLAEISHTLVTFPRLLRESGYETAFIGKWHMGFDDSRRPGFDHWVSFRAQGLYIDGVVNVNDQRRQLTGYMTDFLNESAARFLQKPHARPFALYVAHKAVHFPYLPAKRHDALYADATYQPPQVQPGDMEGKPALRYRNPNRVDMLHLEGSVPEPAESRRGRPETPDAVVRDQARCMASVDDGMGMILDTLKKTGQLDNTVVMFTSDNGFLMGEHGQFDQKRWAWDDSIRLPFLIRYPKLIRAGTTRTQMSLNIDLAPTMLELAGVQWDGPMHGRSFADVLRNPDAPFRNSFLAEFFGEKTGNIPDWQAVRTDHWKYIHYTGNEKFDEFYDLEKDPGEVHNGIMDARYSTPLAAMRSELKKLVDETSRVRIVPHDVRDREP